MCQENRLETCTIVIEHKITTKEAKQLNIPIDKCNYDFTAKNGMKCYFFAPVVTKNKIRDSMDNSKRNVSSIKQVKQMEHNVNIFTLSSEKIDDYSQLTCPTMHLQYQNTDINVESSSEIESGNGNSAEITIDNYLPSKDKLLRMLSRLVEQKKDSLLQVDNRLN